MIKSALEEDIVVIEVVLPSLHQKIDELREKVREYISEGHRKFVLHILGGNRFTSFDIGVLISVYANIKKAGGDVAMWPSSGRSYNLLY